jgi:Zn-dependent M28 family amino/carboxypeptidase
MIGYNATNNGVFQIEAGNSPSTKIITDCLSSVNQAYRLNLAPQIINQNASDRSDHVSFWKKNIPAVWIFDGFDSNGNVIYPFYHRPSDQLANLIKECPREEVNLLVKTTPTQAILNWDPVASAVSYHILRSLTGCSFDWRSMAVVNVTNWKDTSVQNGTNYYYRVEANFGPQASRCVSVSQSCIQARP